MTEFDEKMEKNAHNKTAQWQRQRHEKIQIITKLFEITLCGLAVRGLIIGLLAALSSFIYR